MNLHRTLYTAIKNLNDEINNEKRLISVAEEKIALAQSIVDDDTKNYSLGRVTLNDLIDEVNKLEDNKFNRIVHEVQLKKLVIEWLRMTDNLVRESDIYKKKGSE